MYGASETPEEQTARSEMFFFTENDIISTIPYRPTNRTSPTRMSDLNSFSTPPSHRPNILVIQEGGGKLMTQRQFAIPNALVYLIHFGHNSIFQKKAVRLCLMLCKQLPGQVAERAKEVGKGRSRRQTYKQRFPWGVRRRSFKDTVVAPLLWSFMPYLVLL